MASTLNLINNLLTNLKSTENPNDDDTKQQNDVQHHAATGYDKAQQSVYVVSEELPKDTPVVKGPDFNHSRSIDHILNAFRNTGFQASNLANAVDQINEMV